MLVKITPDKGGFFTESTPYDFGPVWVDGDKVRFRFDRPKHIGGWQKFSESTVPGTPRTIKVWTALNSEKYVALGTENGVFLLYNDTVYDITPIRATSSGLSGAFDTTISDATVTVTDTAHGAVVGDRVVISGSSAVGGLTINGTWTIATVIDGNSYTFEHTSTATSSVSGGGGAAIEIQYTVNSGTASATFGYGWGTGPWGEETWGEPRSTSTFDLDLTIWNMDTWGEDLIIAQRGGSMYYWDVTTGPEVRASTTGITNAPASVGTFVVTPDRHVIVFGSVPTAGGAFDPLVVRWCDQEDFDTWTPASTNTAGELRIQAGNTIIAAVKTREQIIILTDTDAHVMRDVGAPFTFGIVQVGTHCGISGPNAFVTHESRVWWQGVNNYYEFNGTVNAMPCPIHSHVFNDLNLQQLSKITGGLNRLHNEIWFFYPTAGSQENDAYAIFNYTEGSWYFGTLERTVWHDSDIYTYPLAGDSTGLLYEHENGYNDENGSAISAYVTTGPYEYGTGDSFTFIDKLIPDAVLSDNKNIAVSVYTRAYPNTTLTTKGTFSVSNTTGKVSMRARGRQWSFKFESSDTANDWKLGEWRANIQPDGKRA